MPRWQRLRLIRCVKTCFCNYPKRSRITRSCGATNWRRRGSMMSASCQRFAPGSSRNWQSALARASCFPPWPRLNSRTVTNTPGKRTRMRSRPRSADTRASFRQSRITQDAPISGAPTLLGPNPGIGVRRATICGPRCSAQTTGWFPTSVWSWASPVPAVPTSMFCSPAWRVWLPARAPWPWENGSP